MYIHSNFKDFYDFAVYDTSETPYWHRTEESVQLKEQFSRKLFFTTLHRKGISFSSFLAPEKEVKEKFYNGTLFGCISYIVTIGTRTFLITENLVDFRTWYYDLSKIGKDRKYSSLDEIERKWFIREMDSQDVQSIQSLMQENECPLTVAVIDRTEKYSVRETFILNPKISHLKHLLIQVMTEMEIRQEIETYLNKLREAKVPNRVGNDKLAALSAGFDEKSFRNPHRY